jgi:hypothetical protein
MPLVLAPVYPTPTGLHEGHAVMTVRSPHASTFERVDEELVRAARATPQRRAGRTFARCSGVSAAASAGTLRWFR